MGNRVLRKIINEWLFFVSAAGLVATSLVQRRIPVYTKGDFKILFTIFVFLVIVKGLEEGNFLDNLALKFSRGKFPALKLVLLTGILSMFVTNDVALLSVVPLTLAMDIENKATLVILETLAANGASALTPFGNPQNIFIYYFYSLHPVDFVLAIAPFALVSFALVLLMSVRHRGSAKADAGKKLFRKTVPVYLIFFALFVLSVLKILPIWVGLVTLLYAIIFDREALKVDYFLLLTFFVFFGFTDNLIHMLKFKIADATKVFLYSAFASQIISNVPSALLFADFTHNWRALLWGVSVGGFGNLIGSLASLISYRLYRAKSRDSGRFLLYFHAYSYLMFFIGVLLYFLFGNP